MSYKIDLRDRKIMFELDKNARQSIAEISKKTKIPRSIVEYRIKKLTSEKIITKFVTEVALGKVGFFIYRIYCQISGLSKEDQKKFYEDLIKDDNFIWIAKCEGRWDLLLGVYAENVIDFGRIKSNFLLKYGKYISDYAITIIDEAYILERTHLSDKKNREFIEKYIGGTEVVKLGRDDKRLLQLMTNDARIKIVELSKKLDLNVRTVINKIDNLEKLGIIQGYTTFFDLNKINYEFYKICVYLKELNEKSYKDLITFCKNQQHIVHLIESIGPWELELEIEVTSTKQFQEISNDIRNIFSSIVRKVESVIISDEMKLEFLPKKL